MFARNESNGFVKPTAVICTLRAQVGKIEMVVSTMNRTWEYGRLIKCLPDTLTTAQLCQLLHSRPDDDTQINGFCRYKSGVSSFSLVSLEISSQNTFDSTLPTELRVSLLKVPTHWARNIAGVCSVNGLITVCHSTFDELFESVSHHQLFASPKTVYGSMNIDPMIFRTNREKKWSESSNAENGSQSIEMRVMHAMANLRTRFRCHWNTMSV